MKLIIRNLKVFFLLSVSMNAFNSAYGQTGDGLAKNMSFNPNAASGPSNSGSEIREIDTSFYQINTLYKSAMVRLRQQAEALREYAATNDYNTEYCFLVDMSVPDGKNRFFVYNLKNDSLEASSLVSQGFGSTIPHKYAELVFSNVPNSYMTSLGKYKIGSSYKGTYGLSYKLYGLDSTNNRAFERTIVLHSDAHVPESEPFPYHIYQSAGCPTVSPLFLGVLTKYIRSANKPILLWIYYA